MTQFIDQAIISVRSGDGGPGMVAWRREKYEPLGGPAGGTGGRGGNVFIVASADVTTLVDFRYKAIFEAPPGGKGGPKNRHGKDAEDLNIKVPIGTVVYDADNHEAIYDLCRAGEKALVAAGGRGGKGNNELASTINRAPYFCEPGQPGCERKLELELKMLADVGLVGLPNAGKSSLLAAITHARPKIADYPFSTLSPNLGVVKKPDGDGYVIADIPGLVEGANEGVGLGHQFLRHIERTRLIIHMVDISDPEIETTIATIENELQLHKNSLVQLPQILVLNKSDLMLEEEAEQIKKQIAAKLKKLVPQAQEKIYMISCATKSGIEDLKKAIIEKLAQMPNVIEQVEVVPDAKAFAQIDDRFFVSRKKNVFYVSGEKIERVLAVTNLRSPEAVYHFARLIRAIGVVDELRKLGCELGSKVVIAGIDFVFGENLY